MKERRSKSTELSRKVALCGQNAIEINGQVLTPDITKAYGESFQAHAFPVVTLFGTALHPQVVANSFRSMKHQLLDLHHLIVAYDPEENPRDRSLGSIVDVEFPPTPEGGWKVQSSKSSAPCIRAVWVVHRQLEDAENIITLQRTGQIKWTVSMEHKYYMETSGYIVQGKDGVDKWEKSTPGDLRGMGYIYVPHEEAPEELQACFDDEKCKILEDFKDQKVVCLLGGLSGTIHFMGIGLTPIGKEKEAYISQMLASGISYVDIDGELVPRVMAPLQRTLGLLKLKP